MKKREWMLVDVSCPSNLAEELAMEVAEAFKIGVETTHTGIRFYLGEEYFPVDWEKELYSVINEVRTWHHGIIPVTWTKASVPDGDWADRWKEYFKPLRVGKHIIVCPTWEDADPGLLDRVIRLDPGRAFGTGQHETTRLCLEWLEEWASNEVDVGIRSLLDVGTGSGILSIGGALLGIGRIAAVDMDPEAIEVAVENITLNGFADLIVTREGTADDVFEFFDVVVANIQSNPLREMAGSLVHRLKLGGRIILSGILVDQKDDVRETYESFGMKLLAYKVLGEWCLLVFG